MWEWKQHQRSRLLWGNRIYSTPIYQAEKKRYWNLPTPVTVTFVRQDKGLVDVIPTSTQQGSLEVSLDESKNLDDNQGVLRIQKDGQVFELRKFNLPERDVWIEVSG